MKRKTIITDVLAYLPVKLLPAISGIFLVLAVTQALPQKDYVSFSIGMTISVVLMQLGVGWIGAPIIFYLPTVKRRDSFLVSSLIVAIFLILTISLVSALITFAVVGNLLLSLVVSAMCMTQSIFLFASAICQAERKVSLQLWMAIVANGIILILVVCLMEGAVDELSNIFIALFFAYLTVDLVFIYFTNLFSCFTKRNATRWRVIPWCRRIFSYGGPMSFWVAGTLLIVSCDKFFVGPLEFSGLYLSAKDLLIGFSSLLSMPLIMALHPVIFSTYRSNNDHWIVVKGAVEIISVVFGTAWCFLDTVGFEILGAVANKNYLPIKLPLLIVFFGLYLGACLVYFQKDLEIKGRTSVLAAIVCSVCFGAVLLVYLFVPLGGLLYAGLILVCAQFLCLFVILSLSKKISLLMRPLCTFVIVVLVGELVVNLAIWFCDGGLVWPGIAIGLALYFVIAIYVIYYNLRQLVKLEMPLVP